MKTDGYKLHLVSPWVVGSLWLWLLFPLIAGAQQGIPRIAFWNVENFFDTRDDSLKLDDAFTPQGDNHWTIKRYEDKRNKIFKVIAALDFPLAIGLAEVENDWVLNDLCLGTPLRHMGYDYVHYESPDRRGVDCALLYRKGLFDVLWSRRICVSDSAEDFFTRDILLVHGVAHLGAKDDTCYLLVNHWPSKLGGAVADRHRLEIASRMMALMDSLWGASPQALVLAMGDFNASADEEAVYRGLGFEGKCENALGFYSLMYQIPLGTGSYKYQERWSCIDQMFANRDLEVGIFAPDFMLLDDKKYLGKKLFRTYSGMRYLGGYSDHLPIYVNLW